MKALFLASAVALAAATASVWHFPAQAQQPGAAQSSVVGGVTVKVTLKKRTASELEFAVVLDTHSQDLQDDLERTAVLVAGGRELQPLKWQGAAAGGHHREGVLSFPLPPDPLAAFDLRVMRPGEAAPRVFRWESAPGP